MFYKDISRVKADVNFNEGDDVLWVGCLWSQLAKLPFSSSVFGVWWIFFVERHVDQTVDRLETRFEFAETEDLLKKSAGRRQRNLVAVEVFKNVSTKHFACSSALSSDSGWSEMVWAPRTKPTPWQRCKWRSVIGCACTVTRVPIQMRKRAKILKIISQKKTDQLFANLEPGPSLARHFSHDMLLLTTTAREGAWCLPKITSQFFTMYF